MNIIGAIVAGLVGTVVMTMLMVMAPRMGLPKMDIVGLLGTMFNKNGNAALGWIMHLLMGSIFAVVYAALWSAGIGSISAGSGILFGAVHWLIVGLMMSGVSMVHAGVKAGVVEAPGIYMMNNGGVMAFMGGLIGHMVYGLVVALVYGLLIG
jgi:hypothetical protein